MKVIDLTHTITEKMPVFPGTEQPQLITVNNYDENGFRETLLKITTHTGSHITLQHITTYGAKATAADFLLFNLGWDKYWGTETYLGQYPCLNDEAINFILEGSYKGIGFDVMGIDPINDENLTLHKKLFKNKQIVNIENLKNLDLCGSDLFWFSCFPLKIANSDGSPVRAVAWFEE